MASNGSPAASNAATPAARRGGNCSRAQSRGTKPRAAKSSLVQTHTHTHTLPGATTLWVAVKFMFTHALDRFCRSLWARSRRPRSPTCCPTPRYARVGVGVSSQESSVPPGERNELLWGSHLCLPPVGFASFRLGSFVFLGQGKGPAERKRKMMQTKHFCPGFYIYFCLFFGLRCLPSLPMVDSILFPKIDEP